MDDNRPFKPDEEVPMNWARIIVLAMSVGTLAFPFQAKAVVYEAQNENLYGDQNQQPNSGWPDRRDKCDDQVANYQMAVNACLNNAASLAEARDCWSAQP